MSHPAYIAIRFESLLADRFYYFEMPSVWQYCKQNEYDLLYFLYSKKAAHTLILVGSSVITSNPVNGIWQFKSPGLSYWTDLLDLLYWTDFTGLTYWTNILD